MMKIRERIKIGKTISVVAVILCFISFMLPWGIISHTTSERIDIYPWGLHYDYSDSYVLIGESYLPVNIWVIFYTFFFGTVHGTESATTLTGGPLPVILLFLSVIFLLISLLLGVLSLKRMRYKRGLLSMLVGVLLLLAIVFFYVGITNVTISYEPLQWALGTYLVITSAILFFINCWIIQTNKLETNE